MHENFIFLSIKAGHAFASDVVQSLVSLITTECVLVHSPPVLADDLFDVTFSYGSKPDKLQLMCWTFLKLVCWWAFQSNICWSVKGQFTSCSNLFYVWPAESFHMWLCLCLHKRVSWCLCTCVCVCVCLASCCAMCGWSCVRGLSHLQILPVSI